MTWRRRLGIGAAALVGLLLVGAVVLYVLKPWQPAVEVADAGPGGRRVAQDGVLGNYYPSPGGPGPAILVIGGSESGIGRGADRQARELGRLGYATLVVSYFRAPGQSRTLENIPLETFDRALAWLARQPGVDAARLAVVGTSKGAEAALLVATRRPELRAVVAAAPTSVVWTGVDWEAGGGAEGSSWSAEGKPLPALSLGPWTRGGGLRGMYDAGLPAQASRPETVIPIERARAPVLLVCGGLDALWPACPMAEQVADRARRLRGPPVQVLAFPLAGHGVHGVPIAPGDARYKVLGSMGGTAEANAAARVDNWPKTLAFLRAALA